MLCVALTTTECLSRNPRDAHIPQILSRYLVIFHASHLQPTSTPRRCVHHRSPRRPAVCRYSWNSRHTRPSRGIPGSRTEFPATEHPTHVLQAQLRFDPWPRCSVEKGKSQECSLSEGMMKCQQSKAKYNNNDNYTKQTSKQATPRPQNAFRALDIICGLANSRISTVCWELKKRFRTIQNKRSNTRIDCASPSINLKENCTQKMNYF